MFQPSAKIIADSINPCGNRLTTFVLKFHRFVLPEFNTHRAFSRNASSSRAIPIEKLIANIIDDDVYPLHWGKNQKGMSAKEELSEESQIEAREYWESARDEAIAHALALVDLGVHKQVVNRLLEPFSTITVICTSTDYQNFFTQRCHPDAQPEIQALANAMREVYKMSEPKLIKSDDPIPWHIPFLDMSDWEMWHENELTNDDLIKIAVGRCARVSYLNHDGVRDIQDDIKLHDRLISSTPPHFSPFEHIAIALPNSEKRANFVGWESYRYQLELKVK